MCVCGWYCSHHHLQLPFVSLLDMLDCPREAPTFFH